MTMFAGISRPSAGRVTGSSPRRWCSVDIETGLVIFEWHSLGDIALSESYTPPPKGHARWDHMHVNSVVLDASGDIVISSRVTHAVYRISRTSGRLIWRLGG